MCRKRVITFSIIIDPNLMLNMKLEYQKIS